MKNKLTDRFLQNLRAPSSGRLEIFDTLVRGFGLRVGTSNRPAFFVTYRIHGKQIRQTLGRYPALTLGEARAQALDSLRLAGGGVDPALEKQRQAKSQVEPIAEEFLQRYAQEHQQPATYANTQRYIRANLVPRWGHLPLANINKTHIRVLLDDLMDAGKGTTANRVFATLSRLFNWCVEQGYLETSPLLGMRAPAKEVTRDRTLSLDELGRIWRAADELGYPFGSWVQMMLASGGQRAGDVSRMQWPEIRGQWWEIQNPTKSKTSHRVPLSSLALSILDKAPRFEGPYVFSTRGGEIPIGGHSKIKRRLDELSNTKNWRFHDIRRTVATLFGEHLGKHPYVIERIQNRKSGTIKGVMAVYNRASYEQEIASALAEWGLFLRNVANETKWSPSTLEQKDEQIELASKVFIDLMSNEYIQDLGIESANFPLRILLTSSTLRQSVLNCVAHCCCPTSRIYFEKIPPNPNGYWDGR